MEKPLRILHLEDNPNDAGLVEWELKKGGFAFELTLTDNREGFEQALDEFLPDIILSDHSLPSFNSMQALDMVREKNIQVPFILVTATVSEDFAVESMKQGAWDYILKDRMTRLSGAVVNAHTKHLSVAEKQRTEEMLKRSQANLRTILDHTDTGFILIDSSLKVTSFNEKAVKMSAFYFNKQLVPGTGAVEYFPPARQDFITDIMQRAINGEHIEYEISYPQPDGSYKWFDLVYTGIRDDGNTRHGLIMSITDINDRKMAALERDRIAADLISRNKALEQFSYVVSHNLRGPVSSILGLSYLFRDTELTQSELKGVHDAMAKATQDLDKIVKDLNDILHATQHQSEQETDIPLAELVEHIRESILPIIQKEEARIEFNFSEASHFRAARSQLYSIFYNLILNGIKFRKPGIPPVISIKTWKSDNRFCISFTDNGQGIEMEKHGSNLFSLYNRINETKGRGLGLFMVKTHVDMLNGHISVKSSPGAGTEFLMSFPLPKIPDRGPNVGK